VKKGKRHLLACNEDKKFKVQTFLWYTVLFDNEPEEKAELQDDIHRGKSEHHHRTSYQYFLCATFTS
jgi:hypothetical protein